MRSPRRRSLPLAGALALALLLSQWLALAHGVLHRGGHARQAPALAASAEASAWNGIFSHQDGADGAACRLVDQLADVSIVGTAPQAAPPLPAAPALVVAAAESPRLRPWRAHRARAPPPSFA